MNVVSLDLELNQLNDKPKIIEIGVTIGHLESRTILDKKAFLVNPEEEITEYITTLTSISNNMVKDAPVLFEAYEDMRLWLEPFEVQRMMITWGAGDAWALRKELTEATREGIPFNWCFGFSEMNVKNLVQAHRISQGLKMQGGLAKSMTRYGLKFEGKIHRAVDDSFNTLRMYYHILDLMKLI